MTQIVNRPLLDPRNVSNASHFRNAASGCRTSTFRMLAYTGVQYQRMNHQPVTARTNAMPPPRIRLCQT